MKFRGLAGSRCSRVGENIRHELLPDQQADPVGTFDEHSRRGPAAEPDHVEPAAFDRLESASNRNVPPENPNCRNPNDAV